MSRAEFSIKSTNDTTFKTEPLSTSRVKFNVKSINHIQGYNLTLRVRV